jgi:hypothetical protein
MNTTLKEATMPSSEPWAVHRRRGLEERRNSIDEALTRNRAEINGLKIPVERNRMKSKRIQLDDPVAVAIATIETADDRAHERLVHLASLRRFRSRLTVRVLDKNEHAIWCEGQPGWQLFWAQLCIVLYKRKAAFYVEGTDARGRKAFSTVRFEC